MFEVGVLKGAKVRRAARVGIVAFMLIVSSGLGMALSAAAPPEVQCNGVFSGQTPNDPIVKTADKTEVAPGEDVTYTVEWHSTGVDSADVTDCFRVVDADGNEVDALSPVVEVLNYAVDFVNEGDDGSLQHLETTVTIPDDDSLIGYRVQNRVKITHGSVESRSAFVEVSIVEPPCTENCGGDDGTGDDGTGDDGTGDDGTGDDGTGDDGTGDDGTTDGDTDGSTQPPAGDDTQVLGKVTKRAPLATTGPETTMLAWLGFSMLVMGAAMRFVRFPAHAAAAGAPARQDLIAQALRRSTRNWTCNR